MCRTNYKSNNMLSGCKNASHSSAKVSHVIRGLGHSTKPKFAPKIFLISTMLNAVRSISFFVETDI